MKHKKILIVDDEPIIVAEFSEWLESLDYQCVTALNVDEALATITEDNEITLVITDMRMPGKNGAELIYELKNNSEREFEYVVLSGHLDVDQGLQDIKGADLTLMRKPVETARLEKFLEDRDWCH